MSAILLCHNVIDENNIHIGGGNQFDPHEVVKHMGLGYSQVFTGEQISDFKVAFDQLEQVL